MEHSGFFERTGIQRKNVHFCRDVKDKAPIVAKLELDGFVDDRIDVLRPMLSLPRVRPLLFMLNPEAKQVNTHETRALTTETLFLAVP